MSFSPQPNLFSVVFRFTTRFKEDYTRLDLPILEAAMSEFDEEELSKLAKLCRIECTEEEKKNLHQELRKILKHIKQLKEVDTEGVEPCYSVLQTLTNVMREDEVCDLLDREQFLANAPSHVGGMIRVPLIIKSATS